MTTPIRLIFKDPEEADGLRAIADHEGWANASAVMATVDRPLEIVWQVDVSSLIRYVEDQYARFAYLQLDGPQADQLAQRFRKTFDLWTGDEIASLGRGDDNEAASAAMLAGLSAPGEPDDLYAPMLEHALRHQSPAVRARAIEALTYPAWSEFAPSLARMASDDTDHHVRELAGRLAPILSAGAA
jgi:HEAT repeats